MDAVAGQVDERAVRTILDLGCGTGRFSPALATRFNAKVIGLDPSRKMLDQARSRRNHSGVFYVCGNGEAIPLLPNTVDLIFISMVFHHFKKPQQLARECARILKKSSRVFLRTGCCESISKYPYVPYFPASRALLEQRLPSLQSQQFIFNAAALKTVESGVVTQQIASSYSEYADKLSTKADSVLISLNDEEFEAGIEAVRRVAAEGAIAEPIDFIVFEKQGRGALSQKNSRGV
jgi:ubiquinone/menaquinone biosynthesis C-methylase UbiE